MGKNGKYNGNGYPNGYDSMGEVTCDVRQVSHIVGLLAGCKTGPASGIEYKNGEPDKAVFRFYFHGGQKPTITEALSMNGVEINYKIKE